MNKTARITALALCLAFASAAWAKIPPPPPPDEKAKAAAEEKKAKDAAAAEKAKQDQTAAEDKAVKNFQDNMRKKGKPIPKPTPVAVASAPPKGGAPKPAMDTKKGDEKAKPEPKK